MTFLALRKPWLRVETIDRGDDRWDVALVIDGTYLGESCATRDEMVAFFTSWIAEELGAPTTRRNP